MTRIATPFALMLLCLSACSMTADVTVRDERKNPPDDEQPAGRDQPQRIPVRLLRVIDGDTIVVAKNGKEEKLRLRAINAAERGQEGWKAARDALQDICQGRDLTIEYEHHVESRDSYGRLVAYLWADNTLVQKHLIAEGHARLWQYNEPSKYANQLQLSEAD
jgi:micrococcal nuclease